MYLFVVANKYLLTYLTNNRNIPPKSYKTVLDAYNGYHQVPLDEASSKLTTILTEFGRFQYLRAPQGHLASGDAYTRRYDDIISDVPRKHKIVDDVLLYDKGIEEAFYHVFDYLYLCGENGITIHPGKFKFAQSQVDFVGYNIGCDDYKPSDDMLSAIRNFPMPDNPSLADIRSWFGLVNQVAPFLATAPVMAPFRDLLKPSNATGKKVYWDSELQQLFESTKSDISELASRGLAYYDTNRRTAVITDWSKKGIGFVIMQKHYNCVNDINDQKTLNCCKQGWRLAFCNSRHLDKNEQEYAPIEGEALAVCWALRKARLFLLGCPHFEVIVDHNPLLKIFGDKCLNDILNPRLFDFKEKTLPYSFTIRYIKRINNHANTFSRYPVGEPDKDDIAASDMVNTFVQRVAAVTTEKTLSVTLESLLEASKEDEQYQELFEKVKKNTFAECMSAERPSIREFYNVKDRLNTVDNLIMYGFESGNLRLVIPKKLRHQIIVNLHSANQASTSMLSRARQAIYWPGMDRDINNHVQSCLSCRESAPSHVREPILLADIPEFPFQNVVADLFEIESYKYLVYADRLTGFVELAYFSSTTTSTVIINTLREFFRR